MIQLIKFQYNVLKFFEISKIRKIEISCYNDRAQKWFMLYKYIRSRPYCTLFNKM